MLRNIEEEEMEASLERVYKKQVLLRETSHLIAGIAIVSVVIAFLFLSLSHGISHEVNITVCNWKRRNRSPRAYCEAVRS